MRPTQTPTRHPSARKSPPPDRPCCGGFIRIRNGRPAAPSCISSQTTPPTSVRQLLSFVPPSIPTDVTTEPRAGSSSPGARRAT